VKHIKNEGMY